MQRSRSLPDLRGLDETRSRSLSDASVGTSIDFLPVELVAQALNTLRLSDVGPPPPYRARPSGTHFEPNGIALSEFPPLYSPPGGTHRGLDNGRAGGQIDDNPLPRGLTAANRAREADRAREGVGETRIDVREFGAPPPPYIAAWNWRGRARFPRHLVADTVARLGQEGMIDDEQIESACQRCSERVCTIACCGLLVFIIFAIFIMPFVFPANGSSS